MKLPKSRQEEIATKIALNEKKKTVKPEIKSGSA